MTEKLCPSCRRPLPDDAPAGLCPVCALSAANEPQSRRPLPPLEEIQAAFPQFEILECIGHGGMGVVYKVRQRQLGRVLALKILLPGLNADPGFTVRFEREAKTLAKLNHPGIVSIFDYGETEGFCWLTMEYVEGVNLRQAMQAARFTPEQALAVIPEICAGLQYAHEQGVLHRDIKPENILLDAAGKVKIVDFGIARLVDDETTAHTVLTYTGSALGSPAYAAPEQIEQPHRVDHRADLYSLGVVLYEMLTGELPLGRFPAPSRKSGSPPQLDQVVFRTLEKEPDERYQSADEMRREVQGASSGDPAGKNFVKGPRLFGNSSLPPWAIVVIIIVGIWVFGTGVLMIGKFMGLFFIFSKLGLLLLVPLLLVGIGFSWNHLWKAQKNKARAHPAAVILGAWLPVLGVAVYMAALRAHEPRLFHAKGDHLWNVLEVFGVTFAAGLPLFWLARSSSTTAGKKVRLSLAATALILMTISLAAVKRGDGRWPSVNFYAKMSMSHIESPRDWKAERGRWRQEKIEALNRDDDMEAWSREHPAPVSLVSSAVKEINRDFGGKLIVIDLANPDLKNFGFEEVGIYAENFDSWSKYARAFANRLERMLPSESAMSVQKMLRYYVEDSGGSYQPGSLLRDFPSTSSGMNFWFLLGSSASGLLGAWCLANRNGWPLAFFGMAWTAAFFAPVWVRPGDIEDNLLRGPAPKASPFQLKEDRSNPLTAAQTFLDAAWLGNRDAFARTLALDCRSVYGRKDVVDDVMRRFRLRAWASGTRENFAVNPASQPTVVVPLLLPDGSLLHAKMCFEEGEWRVASLPE